MPRRRHPAAEAPERPSLRSGRTRSAQRRRSRALSASSVEIVFSRRFAGPRQPNRKRKRPPPIRAAVGPRPIGRMLGPARPVCGMGQGRMTSRIDLGRIEALPAPPATRPKAAPRRNPRLAAGSRGLRARSRARLGMLLPDADRARRRMRRQGRMGRFFARGSTGAGNPADEPISEP